MDEKQAVRNVMYEKRITQTELAEKAGFKAQSNIASLLSPTRKGIQFDNLFRIINALGCELVIRDKEDPTMVWPITKSSSSEQ